MGTWDYFIMDYQKNVRMILTEETHSAVNTCTMETTNSRPAAEDPVFGQTGSANEVETTRYPTPAGWQSVNTSLSVSRLGNLAGHTIGPNILQKVMAGDKVTASVQYYYQGAVTNSNPNIIPNVLNSLAMALTGNATAGSMVHGNAANISSQLSGNAGFISAVEPTGTGGTTPQAFLTILFFDERFNLVAATDGGVAQQQVASSWTATTAPLGLANIKAPRNGYMYAYVSNRSDQDVYFDNLAVGVVAGNIIEENHYYAFGLKISGISSKKLGDAGEGKLKNNYLYNGKELLDEDADLGWLDYGFREYDPQIGRFVEMDPLTDDYPFLSQYNYAGNDPVTNIDVDGLFGAIASTADVGIQLKEVVIVGYKTARTSSMLTSLAASVVSVTIKVAISASNFINKCITSEQAGAGANRWAAYLKQVAGRGSADALLNANELGLYDLFGGNHVDTYATIEEKEAYLRGRIAGDAVSMVQGGIEIQSGGGTAAATGIETAGVGALAGGALALHGLGTAGIAANDAAASMAKLIELEAILKASGGTGEYGDVGGHHIHAKSAFKGVASYDPNTGFSISQEYMNQRGWNHQAMTNEQRSLFKELAASGRPNTLTEHTNIAVKALQAGGASLQEARNLVGESLNNLRNQGVTTPSNIPWYK
jgi:RHS repeat-associated protein